MYNVDWGTILECNINRQLLDVSIENLCKGIKNNEYSTNKNVTLSKEFVIRTIMCLMKNIPMEPVYMYYDKTKKQYVIEKGIETVLSIYLYINGLFFKDENITYTKDNICSIMNENFEKSNLTETKYILNIADNVTKELSFKSFNHKEQDIILNRKISIYFIDCKNNDTTNIYENIFKLI